MSKDEFLDSTVAELASLNKQIREREKRTDYRFGRLLSFVHSMFKRKQDSHIEPLEWFGHDKIVAGGESNKQLFERLKTGLASAAKANKEKKKNG